MAKDFYKVLKKRASRNINIDSFLNNVYSKDFYMENTYTIHEKWNEPYLDSIRENMRKAYEATDQEKEMKNNNFDPQLFSEESFIERLLA